MAVFLLILAGIICFATGYLLFAPFFLEIDTYRQLYRVRFHWLASAGLTYRDNRILVRFSFAGWKKERFLGEPAHPAQKRKTSKPGKRKIVSLKKLQAVMATFQVRKFRLMLDTGDMQANGILFPLFYWISWKTGKELQISFCGGSGLVLEIRNRLSGLIWAYIKN